MARIHGENTNFTINAVAIEDELNNVALEIRQQVSEVTAFADVAEEFVEGKYGWTEEVTGTFDGAAAQGDATIFALLGAGEKASAFDPTGEVAAADEPNYDGNVLLERYGIRAPVNGPVEYSATFRGNGALTRAVA